MNSHLRAYLDNLTSDAKNYINTFGPVETKTDAKKRAEAVLRGYRVSSDFPELKYEDKESGIEQVEVMGKHFPVGVKKKISNLQVFNVPALVTIVPIVGNSKLFEAILADCMIGRSNLKYWIVSVPLLESEVLNDESLKVLQEKTKEHFEEMKVSLASAKEFYINYFSRLSEEIEKEVSNRIDNVKKQDELRDKLNNF